MLKDITWPGVIALAIGALFLLGLLQSCNRSGGVRKAGADFADQVTNFVRPDPAGGRHREVRYNRSRPQTDAQAYCSRKHPHWEATVIPKYGRDRCEVIARHERGGIRCRIQCL